MSQYLKCPHCGAPIDTTFKRCPVCEAALNAAQPDAGGVEALAETLQRTLQDAGLLSETVKGWERAPDTYRDKFRVIITDLFAKEGATEAALRSALERARGSFATIERRAIEGAGEIDLEARLSIDAIAKALALTPSAAAQRVAENERLRQWFDGFQERTKALPVQHEQPSKGCCTYNWHMVVIRDALRALEDEADE